jgi:DNA-binding NarL/FixJ family response regulator
MIGEGKTVTEIADHLCLSVKTISTYRARLIEKLGVRTTAELIRYAVDHHLTR